MASRPTAASVDRDGFRIEEQFALRADAAAWQRMVEAMLEHKDRARIDMRMPEMSGIQFMERARELRLAKPFRSVAITGFGSESDSRDARVAGFDAHVSKPVSLDRLRASVDRF